jgi:hypothetical protein
MSVAARAPDCWNVEPLQPATLSVVASRRLAPRRIKFPFDAGFIETEPAEVTVLSTKHGTYSARIQEQEQ